MNSLNLSDQSKNETEANVNVDLLQFEEDGGTIIYSPAFDLSGYGNNKEEAKASFEISIEEFFRYTLNKKTLFIELKRLGWKIKEGKFKKGNLESPHLASLITENDYLAETLNNKQFTKYDQSIAMPV